MATHEFLEAGMLLLFSISWYWSIAKMLSVRAAIGKSAMFVIFICAGYALGIGSKLVGWQQTGILSPLIWLYSWNLAVTLFDLALVLHFGGRFGRGSPQRAAMVRQPR